MGRIDVARWYIEQDGVAAGPITWMQLQSMARSGRLRPTDLVRQDGAPFWVSACEARDEPLDLPGGTVAPVATRSEPTRRRDPEAVPAACGVANQTAQPCPTDPTVVPPGTAITTTPEPSPAPTPDAAGSRSYAGPAVFALVLAVAGLFWFGLLLGGSSAALAWRARRDMRLNNRWAGSGIATAALLLGAADVLVVAGALAWRMRAQF